MKKLIFSIIVLHLSILFAYRSLPSEAVGFSITAVDTMPSVVEDSDFHYFSLLFDEGYTSSVDLDSTGVYFHSIYKYNEQEQAWTASDIDPFTDSTWVNSFDVDFGMSLGISAIQEPFDQIVKGELDSVIVFHLVSNTDFIFNPLDRYDLTTSEELGDDIGDCNQVAKYDLELQGWVASGKGIFGWTNPFQISIGMPLLINTTDSLTWPSDSTKIINNNKNTDFVLRFSSKSVILNNIR